MAQNMANIKVYKGVVALEMPMPDGPLWWPQGGALHYAPLTIAAITQVERRRTLPSGRVVWAVPLATGAGPVWVAINEPRSDLWGLKAAGWLPADYPLPSLFGAYSPWPSART